MSDLNEQLRADFEAHVRKDLGMPADCEFQWKAPWVAAAWEGAQWAARRAPAAAPIVQPEPSTKSATRQALHVMNMAHKYGWREGGDEGAFEFITRIAYEIGWDDCAERKPRDGKRAATPASSTADAKDAELLAIIQAVKDAEVSGWLERGFTLPTELRARIQTVLTTADAKACLECNGTGMADSGGVHPWGEPALIPCGCEKATATSAEGRAAIASSAGEVKP